MKLKSMMVFSWVATFALSAGADYTATVFEQGSNKGKELFKFELKSKMNGELEEVESKFTDLEGNVAIEQKVILKGSDVVRDELTQKQTNQVGLMEVKDGKIYFTKTVGEKTSTKEEKLGKTFVASSNFQKFVRDNWAQISEGKEVEFRYGVWDRQETVGFEIFKTGTEKVGDQDALVLKMKPSSFIIAALVKPIIFKFKADGSQLLEMNGRVAPKKKDGSQFKDLDAEVVYKY